MKKSFFIAISLLFTTTLFAQEAVRKPVKVQPGAVPAVTADDSGQKDPKGAMKKMPEGGGLSDIWSIPSGELKFYELPYAYDALEKVIDKLTVEIHYDRHHRTYYNNFQKAILQTELAKMPIYAIFANITNLSDAVRNNGGGYFNHVLYWENLSPKGGGEPSGELARMIEKQFGTYKDFVQKFNEAAKSRFGSGWAWLSVDYITGELFISSTPNQDNPMMSNTDRMGVPILALDVWEHAYYLNYQNKRADYIVAFWNLVDWTVVEKRYELSQVRKADTRIIR